MRLIDADEVRGQMPIASHALRALDAAPAVDVPQPLTSDGVLAAVKAIEDAGGKAVVEVMHTLLGVWMECWPAKFQVSATIHHDYRKSSDPLHVPHVGKNFPTLDWTTWHTFAVEKGTGYMRYYVDNALVWDASAVAWRKDIFDNDRAWNFRHCLQIGDSWGGQPTAATDFSKTFDTDYIRVLGR